MEALGTQQYYWVIQGASCWVETPEDAVRQYVSGVVKRPDHQKGSAVVTCSEGDLTVPLSRIQARSGDESGSARTADLVKLAVLNEPELVSKLRLNYNANYIYSFMGPSLVVLNPYKALTQQLYSDAEMQKVQATLRDATALSQAEPHIYAIAARAYKNLLSNSQKQAIVISGESG